jgi:hypothetical protein
MYVDRPLTQGYDAQSLRSPPTYRGAQFGVSQDSKTSN